MRRGRRNDFRCRDGEYYDLVVSRCSMCRDVCGLAVDHTFCIRNCPDYYRLYVQPYVLPLSHVTTTLLTSSVPVLVVEDQLIAKPLFWTSVVSMIVAVLATVAIVALCVVRRRGQTSRGGRCHPRRAPLLPTSVNGQSGVLAGLNAGGDDCNGRRDDDSNSGDGFISLRSTNALDFIGSYAEASERTLPGGNGTSCGGNRGGRQVSHCTDNSRLECSKDVIYALSSSFCTPDNLLPVSHVTSSCEMPRVPTGEIPRHGERSLVGKYNGKDKSGIEFSSRNVTSHNYINNLLLGLQLEPHRDNEFASSSSSSNNNNNNDNNSSLYVHQTKGSRHTKNHCTPDRHTYTSRQQYQVPAAVNKPKAAAAGRSNVNGETRLKHLDVVDVEDSFSSSNSQYRVDLGLMFTTTVNELPGAPSSRHHDYGVRSRVSELQSMANVFALC